MIYDGILELVQHEYVPQIDRWLYRIHENYYVIVRRYSHHQITKQFCVFNFDYINTLKGNNLRNLSVVLNDGINTGAIKVNITFEEVLNNIPSDMSDKILFHLDLFV